MTIKETIELYQLLKQVNEQKTHSFAYDIQNGKQTIQVFVHPSDWGYWYLEIEGEHVFDEYFNAEEECIIEALEMVKKHQLLYF